MFGYIKKQKVFEAAQQLVDFEKKFVDETISKIEKHKDLFEPDVYNNHILLAIKYEQRIYYAEDMIKEWYARDLVDTYNWHMSEYKAHVRFAGQMKFLL